MRAFCITFFALQCLAFFSHEQNVTAFRLMFGILGIFGCGTARDEYIDNISHFNQPKAGPKQASCCFLIQRIAKGEEANAFPPESKRSERLILNFYRK